MGNINSENNKKNGELNEIKNKIRECQKLAIEHLEKYFNSNEKKHAVINMATGTGKTGVMGIIANFSEYAKNKNILIIVPNSILPLQIKEEIEQSFWEKIDYQKREQFKKVIECKTKEDLEEYNKIFVITIQSLLIKYNKDRSFFNQLCKKIDIVIYDEGHREPAKVWSKMSREIGEKTILFTATLFRNDNKSFTTSEKYIYKYDYPQALKDNIVKKVLFKKIDSQNEDYYNHIINFIYRKYSNNKSKKIIIRITEKSRKYFKNEEPKNIILKISELLNSKTGTKIALACHSNFTTEENTINSGRKFKNKKSNYNIFIHQDMLIEGIDYEEVDSLILPMQIDNMKTFIQQVGRIVRKKENDNEAVVYVPSEFFDDYREQWYIYLKSHENDYIEYNEGKFLEKFDLKEKKEEEKEREEIYKNLNIPLAANILTSKANKFNDIQEYVRKKIKVNKFFSDHKEYSYKHIWVLLYKRNKRSPLLKSKIFIDTKLECVVLKEISKGENFYYFYYDSRGAKLDTSKLEIDYENYENICSVFSNDTEFESVNINSTNIKSTGVNSRIIKGTKIQDTKNTVSEKLSFCSNISGNINGKKRSLCFSHSRVNDIKRSNIHKFEKWTEEILDKIISKNKINYLNRFAKKVDPVFELDDYSSIILFLNELYKFKIKDKNGAEIEIKNNIIIESNDDGNFESEFNNSKITVKLIEKNKKPYLLIDELKNYTVSKENGSKSNLEEYINKEKLYNIYYSSNGVIYSGNDYFKPNISFKNINNFEESELSQLIYKMEGLDKCVNEKTGDLKDFKKGTIKEWPLDSIFGLVVNDLNYYKGIFEKETLNYFVCEDLGNELSDFIGIDKKGKKIIVIHCKNHKGKASASAFHDVCSQVQKNIFSLIPGNNELEKYIENHINRLNKKWERLFKDKGISFKCNRIIKGSGNGQDFWKEYKEILNSPLVKKEVWIICNGLSRNSFIEEIKKSKPAEQINQLIWVLLSTQEVLSEVGATLKVFCKK